MPWSPLGLDLWNQAGALSPGTIHLEPSADGHRDEDSSQGNALARLVLSGIEDRLRAYLYRTANGDIASARKPRVRRKAQVQTFLLPLFEINWANSAPGVSWPEAYHVGWLPVFNVWVVTASQDSTEMYGHCDRTIGQFPECADTVAAACQVIEGNCVGSPSSGAGSGRSLSRRAELAVRMPMRWRLGCGDRRQTMRRNTTRTLADVIGQGAPRLLEEFATI